MVAHFLLHFNSFAFLALGFQGFTPEYQKFHFIKNNSHSFSLTVVSLKLCFLICEPHSFVVFFGQ